MALESNANTVEPDNLIRIQVQTTIPSSPQPLLTTATPTSQSVPPLHFDAPPAYTPYGSTTSLVQNDHRVPNMRFISLEVKALRVLAIGSIILGCFSIFVGILAVVFGTLFYCSGTGIWGGLFCIVNGCFCLFRLLRRNSRNIIKTLCAFSMLTVVVCVVSITLSVIGTATDVDMCCSKTVNVPSGPIGCNYTASQLANTLSTCIGFVQTVFTILTTALYAKYSSNCCLDEYAHDFPLGHQQENNHYRVL